MECWSDSDAPLKTLPPEGSDDESLEDDSGDSDGMLARARAGVTAPETAKTSEVRSRKASALRRPRSLEDDSVDSDGMLARARAGVAAPETESSDESEESISLGNLAARSKSTQVDVPDAPAESSEDERRSLQEGHGLPEDDVSDQFASGWRPGQHAGSFVGRDAPLSAQAQVLVANVYLALKRLPREALASVTNALGRHGTESRPLRAASALLGISRSMLHRCVKALQEREWVPREVPRREGAAPATGSQTAAHAGDRQLEVLCTLVRAALSMGDDGYRSYTRHVTRLAVAGVEVGHRYHRAQFAKEAIFLAARCVQKLTVSGLRAVLPGLGVRSSIAVLMDGVPLAGLSAHGRHGSVNVICLNSVSATDGRLRPHLFTWAVQTGGHGGESIAISVLAALAESPVGIEVDELKGSLCLVGGDGAIVLGGADRSKPGTQAAEILWRKVYGILADELLRDLGDDMRLGDLAAPRNRVERDAWLSDADNLHAATEWDKFHREDMSLRRAFAVVPLATELLAICKLMDGWFGYGDGRLMVKQAASIAGTRLRSGGLPGNTRKIISLSAEPGHLLQNFPAYVLAVHGKRAYVRDGHAGTLTAVGEAGRRLTSLDSIVFAALFRDIMRQVAPWGLAVQCSSTEPWALRRVQRRYEEWLVTASSIVGFVRDVVRILVLLRGHLEPRHLRPFVDALFYATPEKVFHFERPFAPEGYGPAFGKTFPTFWSSLNGFLNFDDSVSGTPTFRDVPLLVVPPRCPDEWACIGPHCQCRSRQLGKTPQSILVKLKGRRRKVRAPHWVGPADAAGHRPAGDSYKSHTKIAFAARKKAELKLHGRPDDMAKFRPTIRGDVPRCLFSWTLAAAFEDIDVALSSAARFLDQVAKEHASLYNAEGMSAGMRRVLDAMSACFDWEYLLVKAATLHQIAEFKTVARMLMPYLRHAAWPPFDQFPRVLHSWPNDHDLAFQYCVMCTRLRQMRPQPWWVHEGAVVERVEAGGLELWFARNVWGPRVDGALHPWTPQQLRLPAHAEEPLRRAMTARIAMVLSSLLRPAQSAPFSVSLQGLAFVGYPCRARLLPHKMRSSVSRVWRCRLQDPLPGGLVKLVLPGMAGKLAYVSQPKRKLDWSAVSAALDMNPTFARGRTPTASQAWHAVRIHSFCRPMGSPEAICERVGSLMHQQWSAMRHLGAHACMDEVLLRDAQVTCLGSNRDERICREVAKSMHFLGRRPLVTEAAKRARLRRATARSGAGKQETSSSDESRCSDGWLLDDWPDRALLKRALAQRLEKSVPELNDSTVTAAFAENCPHGRIQAQPLFQEDLRTSEKDRAGSVKRSALQSWLNSDSGRVFLADKRSRAYHELQGCQLPPSGSSAPSSCLS